MAADNELIQEVADTIKGVQENAHAPHTPEQALQIAQIKALIAIAQAVRSTKRPYKISG
jgi:hypothetical protein